MIFNDEQVNNRVDALADRLISLESAHLSMYRQFYAKTRVVQLENKLAATEETLALLMKYMNVKIVEEGKRVVSA